MESNHSLRIDLELIEALMIVLCGTTITHFFRDMGLLLHSDSIVLVWVNYTEWIIAIAAFIIYAGSILESRICKTKDDVIS